MKTMKKLAFAGLLTGALWACQPETTDLLDATEAVNPELSLMAQEVMHVLQNDAAREAMLSSLEGKPFGVTLEEVLNTVQSFEVEEAAVRGLNSRVQTSKASLANGNMPDEVLIPELFLVAPDREWSADELLVSFSPEGKEESWTEVIAYDLEGNTVTLDPFARPNVPVIVVENHGHFAFKKEVELMNILLQEAGMQTVRPVVEGVRTESGVETTKLNNIRLNDDQEPWTKGAAEVYAITSGVRNTSRDAEIAIIDMPYLDHDGTTYYPNQILLFWDDYVYAAANIHLYEKDSGYNYKELVSILVSGVATIVGMATGSPYATVLGDIAGAIIQAMPDDWYTDDDDYVDVFYTIQKNQSYSNYYGASGNARVSMAPFFLAGN